MLDIGGAASRFGFGECGLWVRSLTYGQGRTRRIGPIRLKALG
jgi:hypothetical protein